MEFRPDARQVRAMFATIAGRYDFTNSVLSFGIHHLWRYRLRRLLPKRPDGRALDLCTGTGDLLPLLGERFGSVIGVDFCLPMLLRGRSKHAVRQVGDGRLVQADGLALPFADSVFDVVTVAFGVRNFSDLDRGLAEIRRVLAPNGTLVILEFGQPRRPVWGAIFALYSRIIMPYIGGLLTGNREAYTYLPKTAGMFPCRELFCDRLRLAGYAGAEYRSLSGGIAYLYRAQKSAAGALRDDHFERVSNG